MKNNKGINMNTKYRSIAFGSYLLNNDNKRLNHTIKVSNPVFENDFAAGGFFEEETEFDVILLNNFKQIEFSVNGATKSKTQKIQMPKNSKDNYVFYKHTVKIDSLNKGLNDLLLIFIHKYSKEDIDYYIEQAGTHHSTYVTRFDIIYGESNNHNSNISYDNDYKILKGIEYALHNIFIYDIEFDTFVSGFTPYNMYNFISPTTDIIKFPMSINTREVVIMSPFGDTYLEEEKLNKTEHIAVFSLLNGQLEPVLYIKEKKESVHFYEKKFQDVVMITPELEVTQKGLNTFTTIAICYPFTEQDRFFGTYNYPKWTNGIVSNEVFIKK